MSKRDNKAIKMIFERMQKVIGKRLRLKPLLFIAMGFK